MGPLRAGRGTGRTGGRWLLGKDGSGRGTKTAVEKDQKITKL